MLVHFCAHIADAVGKKGAGQFNPCSAVGKCFSDTISESAAASCHFDTSLKRSCYLYSNILFKNPSMKEYPIIISYNADTWSDNFSFVLQPLSEVSEAKKTKPKKNQTKNKKKLMITRVTRLNTKD